MAVNPGSPPMAALTRLIPLALLFLVGAVGCNGPVYPGLEVTAVTVASHNRDFFPIDHGEAENPSGDCNVCHGGMASFAEFTCLSCHAHEQTSTDSQHTAVDGYLYDSNSCLACHPTGEGALGRDQHTELYFPITSETAHGITACSGCHNQDTYDTFTCIDCHAHLEADMADEHGPLTDYAYATESCIGCHPTGSADDADLSREDHTKSYFPIETGTVHQEEGCAECHTSGTYGAFSCIDCHAHSATPMNSAHDDVTSYEYESDGCYSCHPDSVVLTRLEHTPWFPITTGDHASYGCDDCHKTEGTYQVFTCIGCHEGEHTCEKMDDEHEGEVRDYSCEDQKCLSCHPDGREDD